MPSSPIPDSTPMGELQARHRWLMIIGAILGSQLLICMLAIYLATSDPAHVVIPDYDSKALQWDDEVAARRASDALGWQLTIQVSPEADVYGNRTVRLHLVDRSGRPVHADEVHVTAFHHSRAAQRQQRTMQPHLEGIYQATFRMRRSGLWEFDVRVRQADNLFQSQQVLDLRF